MINCLETLVYPKKFDTHFKKSCNFYQQSSNNTL